MLCSVAILFLLPISVFSLQCMPSNLTTVVSLNNLNWFEFEDILFSLKSEHQDDHCEVQIIIKYEERLLVIKSINSSDKMRTDWVVWTKYSTRITSATHKPQSNSLITETVFIIQCKIYDWCDRNYTRGHLSWLIAEEGNEFKIVVNLLFRKTAEKLGNGCRKVC